MMTFPIYGKYWKVIEAMFQSPRTRYVIVKLSLNDIFMGMFYHVKILLDGLSRILLPPAWRSIEKKLSVIFVHHTSKAFLDGIITLWL